MHPDDLMDFEFPDTPGDEFVAVDDFSDNDVPADVG
jgi:hypothetical protein